MGLTSSGRPLLDTATLPEPVLVAQYRAGQRVSHITWLTIADSAAGTDTYSMRIGSAWPLDAVFGSGGVRLRWDRPCAEERYCGTDIAWSTIRDIDDHSGEIRLHSGRTVFVAPECRDQLLKAAEQAGVPKVSREPVWSWLLEPFLDTDYSVNSDWVEQSLRECGFTAREVRLIRWRVGVRMALLLHVSAEWVRYDQDDLLAAWRVFRLTPLHASWWSYLRFRRWTDEIAERGRPATRRLPE